MQVSSRIHLPLIFLSYPFHFSIIFSYSLYLLFPFLFLSYPFSRPPPTHFLTYLLTLLNCLMSYRTFDKHRINVILKKKKRLDVYGFVFLGHCLYIYKLVKANGLMQDIKYTFCYYKYAHI